ncbi:hypothetical protein [Methanocella paludicola]|nr:hypothetical protein [Methanocella paludicola]
MVTLLAAIMMASSGCVYIQDIINPGPTTTPVVVTLTPTPKPPTVTPAPTVVARQMSTDVKVLPVGEKGLESFNFTKDSDYQKEYITIELANDGNTTAKKVTVTLKIIDAHGGNELIEQPFVIGDMARGDRKVVSLETDKHDLAPSVLITIERIEWGDDGEYYNDIKYLNVARSIWT